MWIGIREVALQSCPRFGIWRQYIEPPFWFLRTSAFHKCDLIGCSYGNWIVVTGNCFCLHNFEHFVHVDAGLGNGFRLEMDWNEIDIKSSTISNIVAWNSFWFKTTNYLAFFFFSLYHKLNDWHRNYFSFCFSVRDIRGIFLQFSFFFY